MDLLLIRHGDPDYPNDTLTAKGHLRQNGLLKASIRFGLTIFLCRPWDAPGTQLNI